MNACLTQFNLPAEKVLEVLCTTGSIISGSAVLVVIERVDYDARDLDIYATTAGVAAVHRFILSKRYMPMEPWLLRGERSDGSSARAVGGQSDV